MKNKKQLSKFRKSQKLKHDKLVGAEGFEKYYASVFGERWNTLKASLLQPVNHFELYEGLRTSYFLDKASYWAVASLPYLEAGVCLDMCAAPGGKSLVLITKALGRQAELKANELSSARRRRLKKVLAECLNDEQLQRIKISGYDGSLMCKYERESYDRILVDAPCSSERHVLLSEKYLSQWSEARIKNLARRQWSLLSSAFLLLKSEGFLLYSTCALSENENDDVIDKLLAKYDNTKIVKIAPFDKCEQTKHGLIFLPDKSGYGPLYFALVKKEAII